MSKQLALLLYQEIELLQRKVKRLEADAARYAFLRDNQAQAHSLHMNGTCGWHIRTVYGRASTFDKLIDAKIQEAKDWKQEKELL